MNQQPKPNRNNTDLLRYAGWGTQLFVALALFVFVGNKIDKWLDFSTPLLVWILPFVVLIVMIYQLVKETSKKKEEDNGQKKI